MLEQASPLKQSMLNSRLKSQSRLRPNGGGHRKKLMASLMLTSLVDAFSILVIFLIMNNATSQREIDSNKLNLPKAVQSQVIENGLVIKVDGDRYLVDSKKVSIKELAQAIVSAKGQVDGHKDGLIIVADQKLDYADLSPVIAVGSQQGYSKFKFVVERSE